jgi:molecular chaperone Hsp33
MPPMDADAPPPGASEAAGAASDRGLRLGVAGRLDFRWAAADVTEAAEEARRRHDLSPIATVALGRALAGAALLQALATRACRRVTLTVAGDGPLGRIVAEADAEGNLRGLVTHGNIEIEGSADGGLRIAHGVGKGSLRVLREHGDGSLSESQVELTTREIGLDLAHYLEQSEQTGSAVLVGVLLGPEGVRSAGGIVVELIPAASDAAIAQLEANLATIDSVSRTLAADGVDGLVLRALAELPVEVRAYWPLRFRCSCDRATLLSRLSTLGADDLSTVTASDGTVEAVCAFCSAHYRFEPEELAAARS